MTDTPAGSNDSVEPRQAQAATETAVPAQRAGQNRRPRGGGGRGKGQGAVRSPANGLRSHPALELLAGWYPQLFGAAFLPLKRGIFQDLLAAHPQELENEALKQAMAIHTRSSRYLNAVAAGLARHDLEGKPVEPMAPEHIYQALLEVFRRRQGRGGEDLRPKLLKRIAQAFEASGLSREAYAALVHGRDEATNALLDQALNDASERAAKDEALLRAYEASGQTVEAFADMYGLPLRSAENTLQRARQRRAPVPAAPDAGH